MDRWSHCIYLLIDTKEMTGYVGQSTKPNERLKQHWAGKPGHGKKNRWLRSLPCAPSIVILERCGESWQKSEIGWIRDLRLGGLKLVNGTGGGQGAPDSYRHSEETREKISKAHKRRGPHRGNFSPGHTVSLEHRLRLATLLKGNRYWRGRSHSKKSRRKISLGLRGHSVSEETRKKIGLSTAGKPRSDVIKQKISLGLKAYWRKRHAEQVG